MGEVLIGNRDRIARQLRAHNVQADPEPIIDPLEICVANALARRGILEVPGRVTQADLDHDRYRQRIADVVEALTPRPPVVEVVEEPEQPLGLVGHLRALIAAPAAEIPPHTDPAPGLALNANALLNRAAGATDPGRQRP